MPRARHVQGRRQVRPHVQEAEGQGGERAQAEERREPGGRVRPQQPGRPSPHHQLLLLQQQQQQQQQLLIQLQSHLFQVCIFPF